MCLSQVCLSQKLWTQRGFLTEQVKSVGAGVKCFHPSELFFPVDTKCPYLPALQIKTIRISYKVSNLKGRQTSSKQHTYCTWTCLEHAVTVIQRRLFPWSLCLGLVLQAPQSPILDHPNIRSQTPPSSTRDELWKPALCCSLNVLKNSVLCFWMYFFISAIRFFLAQNSLFKLLIPIPLGLTAVLVSVNPICQVKYTNLIVVPAIVCVTMNVI